MIMHDDRKRPEVDKPKPAVLYSASGMAKLVRRLREAAKLPATFTLDACRHDGMTELEEAGRSPNTSAPWSGVLPRPVSDAHIASGRNVSGTEFPNGAAEPFPNELKEQTVASK
jgi:hypothetical protein